ncbi:MAG: NAD-dependent protein deacetylase [Pseudomonadota bacterium]|nr:NAD-dependent protein deacetylase [Pseudomonadota bacterium]
MSTIRKSEEAVSTARQALKRFLGLPGRPMVLTGAGCSTDSGIPDYRGPSGAWRSRQPIQFQPFRTQLAARQRYWARSMVGFPRMAEATPNGVHRALANLEARGLLGLLVTQNVDDLHRRAGQRQVLDLHGRLARVRCLDCGHRSSRAVLQRRLEALNPSFTAQLTRPVVAAPDGDAELEDEAVLATFRVPPCLRCDGVLKPDVVFFGESVPGSRVAQVRSALKEASGLLVLGSSLAVFSGFRFCRDAAALGKPIFIATQGVTRGDGLAQTKVNVPLGELFSAP